MRRLSLGALLLLFAAAVALPWAAQNPVQTMGRIQVTVLDEAGQPFPGAIVTLSDPGIQKPVSLQTNIKGIVEFPNLVIGKEYAILISAPGYSKILDPHLTLAVPVKAPAVMKLLYKMIPERQEKIEVAAMKPSDGSADQAPVAGEFFKDMPIAGRNYQSALTLAPGVNDSNGDGNPNVTGSVARDFKATINGISNVDPLTGTFMSNINPDAIEEIEVVTEGADAAYGGAVGGFAKIVSGRHGKNGFATIITAQGDIQIVSPSIPVNEYGAPFCTAKYRSIVENGFTIVKGAPPLTFGAEHDTAALPNVRRFLRDRQVPPSGAVDVTEMVNYFPYSYPRPNGNEPFSTSVEVTTCPWNQDHQLARFGFRTKAVTRDQGPGSSITLLIDVSGSMSSPSGYGNLSKLDLIKAALHLFVQQLTDKDTLAIVVYAGEEGVALGPTSGKDKAAIMQAIDDMQDGGSTNGEGGMRKAYELARKNFVKGGQNHVIWMTDGDLNVGVGFEDGLVAIAKEYADQGIFLSLMGVGMDNLNSALLEGLTRANGTVYYLDSLVEAQKVLVDEVGGNLNVVARDAAFLVDFNPEKVLAYRLVGYEKRTMSLREFYDDTKTDKKGEIGSDQTLTGLVEPAPATRPPGHPLDNPETQARRYQVAVTTPEAMSSEFFQLKIRWKEPTGGQSLEHQYVFGDTVVPFETASDDTRFAVSVAGLSMLLRNSKNIMDADGKQTIDYSMVRQWAADARGADPGGYRKEFLTMIDQAQKLQHTDQAALLQ